MIKNNKSDCFGSKKTDSVLPNLHPSEIDFVLMFERISLQKVKHLTPFFDTLISHLQLILGKNNYTRLCSNKNCVVKKSDFFRK